MAKLVHVVAGLSVAFAVNTAAPAAGPGNDAVALTARVMELARAGKYSEATPLAQRALAIAKSLNNLANLYNEQGRNAEAEPLHVRALAIREKALGPNHLKVTRSLNNLGILYYSHYSRVAALARDL
ncbi:MAG TPA: tetratricopeptide repeat protein [Bradyrhizobium sp.]|jgi:tetratricopeptide (TPR) repeat protein|nr:tetratricopeptide repeat protein [Bradyrhizobium sp.]